MGVLVARAGLIAELEHFSEALAFGERRELGGAGVDAVDLTRAGELLFEGTPLCGVLGRLAGLTGLDPLFSPLSTCCNK